MSDNSTISVEAKHCPMCGAPVAPNARDCEYCGSALIFTSTENVFSRDIDITVLNNSLNKWKDRLKANPNDPQANYALGLIYMNEKLRDAALVYLRKTVQLVPENSLAHYNLALTLMNDGNLLDGSPDMQEAMKEIDYAAQMDPAFAEAQGFKHFFAGKKLSKIDGAASEAEYKQAIRLCSTIPLFQNNLGTLYYKTGRMDEAEELFKEAIEMDNTLIMPYSNLSLLYYKTERYDEGINCAEMGIAKMKDITLDVYKGFLYNNYALCLYKAGRKDEALVNIKKAIAYNPRNPLFTKNLNFINNGCFIATATMGSYEHPIVKELHCLRDDWILTKSWGQQFVSTYYKRSPKYASLISRSKILKTLSYWFIVLPLYCISKSIK